MQTPYISTSFLNGFNALVLSRKGNPAQLYAMAELGNDAVVNDSLLIPFDKFVALLEIAAEQLKLPTVALQLARQQDMMILAPLGPMLSKCHNVSEAITTILQYMDVLVKGYQVDLQVHNGHLEITFTCDLPQIAELTQFQDYALASAYSILHGLAGRAYPLRACYFTRPERKESRVREYSTYFGCPVAFGHRTLTVIVDDSVLKQDAQHMANHIAGRVRRLLQTDEDLVDQVKKVISISLANGIHDIDDIALSMGHSARTLQRKLKDQGTSFRALMDTVRLTLADQYLANTRYRMTDISAMLGYDNQSAFSRSYQRWCGVAPAEARKRFVEVTTSTLSGSARPPLPPAD